MNPVPPEHGYILSGINIKGNLIQLSEGEFAVTTIQEIFDVHSIPTQNSDETFYIAGSEQVYRPFVNFKIDLVRKDDGTLILMALGDGQVLELLLEAPNDEFNLESEKVASRIRDSSTVGEIARTVSKVFSDAFGPQYFAVDACRNVAERIKEALDKAQGEIKFLWEICAYIGA